MGNEEAQITAKRKKSETHENRIALPLSHRINRRMHARWQIWMLLLAGFVCSCPSTAQETPRQVTLRITSVKESDWQREMSAGEPSAGLRERLHAHTLTELSAPLQPDQPTVLRSGKRQSIVATWTFAENRDDVIAKEKTQEFIGTELTVEEGRQSRLSLDLTHDLSPLQLQSLTYATAAEGEERARRSITAPRFERLHWEGEVQADHAEHVLTSFRTQADASQRIVVFFQSGTKPADAVKSDALQRTIYRVPELDILEWLLQTKRDDASMANHLREAVTSGQASIVSSLTTTLSAAQTKMQTGTEWWVPTEVEQKLDQLYQLPVSFETYLEGSRVIVDDGAEVFESFYSPRSPLAVKWPTSWLRVYDRAQQKPTGRAIHGWMEWFDRFEQEAHGMTLADRASPQVVAMMPPADQLWGTDRKGRWLDVTVLQKLSGSPFPQPTIDKAEAEAKPGNDPFAAGPPTKTVPAHTLFIGIALDNETAHALLEARQPEQDASLLRDLLARVRSGKARLLTSALSTDTSGRHTLSSARIHSYPTEMPSVASAWEDEPVGTLVEQEGATMALTQHLTPPARTEWKLALDVPEAIMWEPRFRKFSFMSTTAALTTPGTHLLAAVSIPAVMDSADLPANETLFLFKHLDSKTATPETTRQDVEIETLTFEIPAQDAAAWQAVKSDDFAAFTRQHLQSGRAKLQSQTLLRTQPVPWASLSVVEEYLTATEFDPPSVRAPSRMRPTALQMLPVGLQLKTYLSAEDDGTFVANLNLQHSASKPIEPSLEETLRISADAPPLYPGAKHEIDKWADEEMHIRPGQYHCLGILPPHGSDTATTRIGFIRARPAR